MLHVQLPTGLITAAMESQDRLWNHGTCQLWKTNSKVLGWAWPCELGAALIFFTLLICTNYESDPEMAWTGARKFSGALPGNGRWSSGIQTYIFIRKTWFFFSQPLALQQCHESAPAVFHLWKCKCEILLAEPCTKDMFKAENCWHWSQSHFCTEQYMWDPSLSPAPCLLKPNWNSLHTRNTSIPTKPVLGGGGGSPSLPFFFLSAQLS